MVSLQLIEEPLAVSPIPVGQIEDAGTADIWNPKLPRNSTEWNHPVAFPRQSFNLCLDMNFGGDNGELLSELTRVIVFMGEFPAVFHGMCFVYSDRSERLYGRKTYATRSDKKYDCIAQSFAVFGKGGERINGISAGYSVGFDTIQDISVSWIIHLHSHLFYSTFGFDACPSVLRRFFLLTASFCDSFQLRREGLLHFDSGVMILSIRQIPQRST